MDKVPNVSDLTYGELEFRKKLNECGISMSDLEVPSISASINTRQRCFESMSTAIGLIDECIEEGHLQDTAGSMATQHQSEAGPSHSQIEISGMHPDPSDYTMAMELVDVINEELGLGSCSQELNLTEASCSDEPAHHIQKPDNTPMWPQYSQASDTDDILKNMKMPGKRVTFDSQHTVFQFINRLPSELLKDFNDSHPLPIYDGYLSDTSAPNGTFVRHADGSHDMIKKIKYVGALSSSWENLGDMPTEPLNSEVVSRQVKSISHVEPTEDPEILADTLNLPSTQRVLVTTRKQIDEEISVLKGKPRTITLKRVGKVPDSQVLARDTPPEKLQPLPDTIIPDSQPIPLKRKKKIEISPVIVIDSDSGEDVKPNVANMDIGNKENKDFECKIEDVTEDKAAITYLAVPRGVAADDFFMNYYQEWFSRTNLMVHRESKTAATLENAGKKANKKCKVRNVNTQTDRVAPNDDGKKYRVIMGYPSHFQSAPFSGTQMSSTQVSVSSQSSFIGSARNSQLDATNETFPSFQPKSTAEKGESGQSETKDRTKNRKKVQKCSESLNTGADSLKLNAVTRKKSVCRKKKTAKFAVDDTFSSDSDGIFRTGDSVRGLCGLKPNTVASKTSKNVTGNSSDLVPLARHDSDSCRKESSDTDSPTVVFDDRRNERFVERSEGRLLTGEPESPGREKKTLDLHQNMKRKLTVTKHSSKLSRRKFKTTGQVAAEEVFVDLTQSSSDISLNKGSSIVRKNHKKIDFHESNDVAGRATKSAPVGQGTDTVPMKPVKKPRKDDGGNQIDDSFNLACDRKEDSAKSSSRRSGRMTKLLNKTLPILMDTDPVSLTKKTRSHRRASGNDKEDSVEPSRKDTLKGNKSKLSTRSTANRSSDFLPDLSDYDVDKSIRNTDEMKKGKRANRSKSKGVSKGSEQYEDTLRNSTTDSADVSRKEMLSPYSNPPNKKFKQSYPVWTPARDATEQEKPSSQCPGITYSRVPGEAKVTAQASIIKKKEATLREWDRTTWPKKVCKNMQLAAAAHLVCNDRPGSYEFNVTRSIITDIDANVKGSKREDIPISEILRHMGPPQHMSANAIIRFLRKDRNQAVFLTKTKNHVYGKEVQQGIYSAFSAFIPEELDHIAASYSEFLDRIEHSSSVGSTDLDSLVKVYIEDIENDPTFQVFTHGGLSVIKAIIADFTRVARRWMDENEYGETEDSSSTGGFKQGVDDSDEPVAPAHTSTPQKKK